MIEILLYMAVLALAAWFAFWLLDRTGLPEVPNMIARCAVVIIFLYALFVLITGKGSKGGSGKGGKKGK